MLLDAGGSAGSSSVLPLPLSSAGRVIGGELVVGSGSPSPVPPSPAPSVSGEGPVELPLVDGLVLGAVAGGGSPELTPVLLIMGSTEG